MKKKLLVMIALMLVVAMSLSSCGIIDWFKDLFRENFGKEIELTDAPLNAGMLIDFAEGAKPEVLFESDGWTNGDVFNVVWKKSNVHYEDGIMRLGITEEKASAWLNDVEVEFDYTAGEARTQNYYHYGDYEVSMKPSANGGTASTFFVCTGPYDVKDGVPNAHDEIDIEFLGDNGMGKNTTKVQFNFFVDGVGGNEYIHDLGFDASLEYHTYGFRWEENAITWFVDGKPVYKVTTDTSVEEGKNVKIVPKLPSTAGRILTNYWCGNERAWGWMGEYKGETRDNGTTYQWISTSAEGAPLNSSTQPTVGGGDNTDDPNPPVVNPDEPTRLDVEFRTDHADFYKLEAPATYSDSVRITYDGVVGGSWANVNTWIDGKIGSYDTLSFKIKNDGAAEVNIWLQLQNGGTNVAEQQLVIPAGEEKEFEISYSGNIQIALFFIDSSHVVTEGATYSGDITISEIKVCKKGEEGGELPGEPPVQEELVFNFWVSDGSLYTTDGNNIKYNGAGNTYACVGADISSLAAGKTTFTVTITNNGDASSRVRVDIQGTTQVGKHTVLNTSATGGDVWTDAEWGGSTVTVAAGESVTLVITYDETTDRGAVTNLVVFVDAGRGDAETYNSDITLSGMSFQ